MNYGDGTLVLHQSDISHYITCPEQFRLSNGIGPLVDTSGETWRSESDAALIGSCIHAVIERELSKGPIKTLAAARTWARNWIGKEISYFMENEIDYRTETYGGDPDKTLRAVDLLVESWWFSTERDYWLHRERDSYMVEAEFDVPFVTRPDTKIIKRVRLAGTSDIIDLQEHRVLDWKSASRSYQRWEKQRWAVQPTVYTFAAAEMNWIRPNSDGLYRFDFRVFERGKRTEAQEITVLRGPGQWAWLTKLVNNIADMMESDAAEWPLRDDHALCGPKWCPVWYQCKGAFVTEDWT